jgi:Spy/CpxP family protein refolding chaperone
MAAIRSEFAGNREEWGERFKQARERAEQFADAFVSDSFDARSFEVGKHVEQRALFGADRIVRIAQLALPVLTAEQRSKLAEVVESRVDELD